jgi:protein involved in polysaccharide export with SLBB domain
MAKGMTRLRTALTLMMLAALLPGCSSFRHAVPASCLETGNPGTLRSDKEPINFLRLRQEPPAAYQLGPRDVLGIYIEGVLGNRDEPPPVHFPEDADLPPAVGYPVPVREDGTISLPLIPPFSVEGLTLAQAEHLIRTEYAEKRRILKPESDRTIVTLMRPRTYSVIVVREDTGMSPIATGSPQRVAQSMTFGVTKRGLTYSLELPAYKNDVLNALSETGGMPGVDATNAVTVLRGAFSNLEERHDLMQQMEDPQLSGELLSGPNAVRIPLRLGPYDPPLELSQEDITLYDGDIVFVESRETEVFYTGGLLQAGQFPLPRDYDIDVIEAMAMAGGKISSASAGNDDAFSGRGGGIGAVFPPTQVIVLRKVNGQQVPIAVDLKEAMTDSQQRVRILPGDFIILEYTPGAMFGNVALSLFRVNWLVGNQGF